MATTTHASKAANDACIALRVSPYEREAILETLEARLEVLGREPDRIRQAIAAVRFATDG
jgi:hypothetical protein